MSCFKCSHYGIKKELHPPPFYTDLRDELVLAEYKQFKADHGESPVYPLSDDMRDEFDYQMTVRHADEWAHFLEYARLMSHDPQWVPERYRLYIKRNKQNDTAA